MSDMISDLLYAAFCFFVLFVGVYVLSYPNERKMSKTKRVLGVLDLIGIALILILAASS